MAKSVSIYLSDTNVSCIIVSLACNCKPHLCEYHLTTNMLKDVEGIYITSCNENKACMAECVKHF